jgi:hypothetical protein
MGPCLVPVEPVLTKMALGAYKLLQYCQSYLQCYFLLQKDQGQVRLDLSVAASAYPIVKSPPLASVWVEVLFNNVPLVLESSWDPSSNSAAWHFGFWEHPYLKKG